MNLFKNLCVSLAVSVTLASFGARADDRLSLPVKQIKTAARASFLAEPGGDEKSAAERSATRRFLTNSENVQGVSFDAPELQRTVRAQP